jgi:predicted porin
MEISMKKTLVAMAAAVGAAGVCAQSTVTLFGVVDASWQRASQNGVSATRLNGLGGNQFSRFGVRGTEDLGGGLSAGFVLDAGLNVDSGAGAVTSTNNQTAGTGGGGLTFNRRSTVSLTSKEWGEVRIGRDFAPSYWNLTVFDPFGTAGAGSVNNLAQGALTRVSTVQTAVRASNSIGYFLPAAGGLYGQAMIAWGENSSDAAGGTSKDGRYVGVRLGYQAGAANLAGSWGKTNLASGDVTTTNLAGSYQVGPVKLMAQLFRDAKDQIALPSRSNGLLIGAQMNLGPGYVPVSYTRVKNNSATGATANQFAAGYVYNLSKRSALYGTYSRLQNRNGAALSGGGVAGVANATWTGIDFGVRHTF